MTNLLITNFVLRSEHDRLEYFSTRRERKFIFFSFSICILRDSTLQGLFKQLASRRRQLKATKLIKFIFSRRDLTRCLLRKCQRLSPTISLKVLSSVNFPGCTRIFTPTQPTSRRNYLHARISLDSHHRHWTAFPLEAENAFSSEAKMWKTNNRSENSLSTKTPIFP